MRARGGGAARAELRAGDVVEVRTEEEILSTLDPSGRLERLPFMPEMLRHAGQRHRVFKRADKTCDSIWSPGMRTMHGAVFLSDLRCDGSAHGGCQAGCLFFWKEAWLKPVPERDGHRESSSEPSTLPVAPGPARCTRADLSNAAIRRGTGDEADIYTCQATELGRATEALSDRPVWDIRQYSRDIRSGNVSVGRVAVSIARAAISSLSHRLGRSRPGRRVAVAVADRISTARVPTAAVVSPLDGPGPGRSSALDLRAGDRVRVRSRSDIRRTLDANNRNRGLSFNQEMHRYCGGEYQVLRRAERIINEATGRMIALKDDVILDGVTCPGDYHRFCPRAVYPFWRAAWLERVDDDAAEGRSTQVTPS